MGLIRMAFDNLVGKPYRAVEDYCAAIRNTPENKYARTYSTLGSVAGLGLGAFPLVRPTLHYGIETVKQFLEHFPKFAVVLSDHNDPLYPAREIIEAVQIAAPAVATVVCGGIGLKLAQLGYGVGRITGTLLGAGMDIASKKPTSIDDTPPK